MEKDQKRIKSTQSLEKIFQKTLHFIGLRPRSQKEILFYLHKKTADEKIIAKIMQDLTNLGLMDDAAFLDWWLEQRAAFRPKGKRALIMELRQKGIDNNLIQKAMVEKVDEKGAATSLVEKKLRVWSKLPQEICWEKLTGFLARRGFNWETIKVVLDEKLKKQ
ncbi:MAG: regulatory protein RecX [Candidatus Shapirobacteria bacterium]|nr:regulatory protein RecX [Candidatus Shapirobacteria bacterium]